MPKCSNCGKDFPNQINVDGKTVRLSGRKFCLDCSPFGSNNRRSYIVSPPEGKAYCVRCNSEKDLEEFHLRRSSGKPLSYCKQCQESVKRAKFEEKVEAAVAMWGGICADCQGMFPSPVFRFWKGGKVFAFSRAKNMSWDRLVRELEGHEMLCLNCAAVRDWERSG